MSNAVILPEILLLRISPPIGIIGISAAIVAPTKQFVDAGRNTRVLFAAWLPTDGALCGNI
jgi:hypothetical protein